MYCSIIAALPPQDVLDWKMNRYLVFLASFVSNLAEGKPLAVTKKNNTFTLKGSMANATEVVATVIHLVREPLQSIPSTVFTEQSYV